MERRSARQAALGTSAVDAEIDDRLRDALARARRSPFYADRIPTDGARGTELLARVPLTQRTDIISAPPFARLAVRREELWQYVESSGTAGAGTLAAGYTRDDMARSVALLTPMFLELFDKGRTVMNRFPYALAAVSSTLEWLARERGACIVPASNLSWVVPFPRALDLIRRARPDVLAALPLEAVILGALARHLGIAPAELTTPLRSIIAGGGLLPPALHELLERDWGARVVELYGSTETLALGSSCPARRLHLATENFFVELLDPETWKPVEPGQAGALALTSLHLRGMPLVRYINEDIVAPDVTPCECGSEQPTIRVLGRLGETVTLNGRSLYPTEILDAAYRFADVHASRILLAIVHDRGIRLRVEVDQPGRAPDETAAAELRDRLGVPLDVDFVWPGDLLDCVSLVKVPMVHKPTPLVDWRGGSRRPYTLLNALISMPRFTLTDARRLAGRTFRNYRSRRRLGR